jgi:hypothetical protein
MDPIRDGARQAYARLRLDDHGSWDLRQAPGLISVLAVLSTREEAEAEAATLNHDYPAEDSDASHYVVAPTWVY